MNQEIRWFNKHAEEEIELWGHKNWTLHENLAKHASFVYARDVLLTKQIATSILTLSIVNH